MVRRHYTPELANRSLPLVARIAADIQQAAQRISVAVQDLHTGRGNRDELSDDLEGLRDRFGGLVGELQELGVELKDPLSGLLDFRAKREGEEVYLCWRLGEDAVAFWHSLEGGVAGRRPITEF